MFLAPAAAVTLCGFRLPSASIKPDSGMGLGADMDQLDGEEKTRRRLVDGAAGLTRAAA